MRISNEQEPSASGLADLLRLQSEFQTVLATETMRYLSRLQAVTTTAPGGTVVRPHSDDGVRAAGRVGQHVVLALEIENLQSVHSTVTPVLTVLASAAGTTWFPDVTVMPPSALVAPAEIVAMEISVPLPTELPPATYRGALVLHGFRDDGIPVKIDVENASDVPPPADTPRRADIPVDEDASPPADAPEGSMPEGVEGPPDSQASIDGQTDA